MRDTRVFSLVYASTATGPVSDAELDRILTVSRRRNQKVGLTGILLYRDGLFMQALEGPERAVRASFRRIGRDPRHSAVRVLLARHVPEREFGTWSMSCRTIAEASPAAEGFDDFLDGETGPTSAVPTRTGILLDWFREHAGRSGAEEPPLSSFR